MAGSFVQIVKARRWARWFPRRELGEQPGRSMKAKRIDESLQP